MKKIFKLLFSEKKYSVPLLLLGICFMSYGFLIPTLGLYWDGWPYMWQYHVFGPGGFPQFVASDRPHSAWIFMLLTWLFGTNLFWYHLTIFLFRWLSACLVWWSLNLLWEKKWLANAIAAILFLVYPGFLQQPISLPYSHHISHMALFFFSIWGMLASLHNPKKYWWLILLSVLSALVVNFSLEYFTPLEFLRPLLILLFKRIKTPNKKFSIQRLFITWLPYLAGLAFFLFWRIFIFKFPTYSPKLLDQFSSASEAQSIQTFNTFLKSLETVSFTAWSNVFHFPTISEFGTAATYLYFVLISISAIVLWIFLWHHSKKQVEEKQDQKNDRWEYSISLILIGAISILLPALMYWILKLPILVEFAWDRLNLSFIFGVSIMMSGLVDLIKKATWLKVSLVVILISLAIGFHFQNGMAFKRDWETFQNFFWQLTWRSPNLEKGTVILTTDFPLRYYSDNSLTAPLNWTYDAENRTSQLNFLFYFTDVRLKSQRLDSLSKDQPIHQPFRSFFFEGNTNQSLVLRYSPPGCLQVLDQEYANSGILPNLTQLEADAIPLSNLSQIITDSNLAKKPPSELFGQEPPHDWCYYFEKADLARQKKDWMTILRLAEEAKGKNLWPRNPSDWLPFIEAYIRSADFTNAKSLIDDSLREEKYYPGICYSLIRISKDSELSGQIKEQIQQLEADYNCQH